MKLKIFLISFSFLIFLLNLFLFFQMTSTNRFKKIKEAEEPEISEIKEKKAVEEKPEIEKKAIERFKRAKKVEEKPEMLGEKVRKEAEKKASKILKEISEKEMPQAKEEAPVIAFKIKKVDFKETIPVLGTVTPFEEVKLKFEEKGKIKAVYKKEGEKVKKGDILAELDERDLKLREEYAKNKYESERNLYLSMQKEYELKKRLYEKGAILKEKLEELELKLESQKYKMKSARNEWELAKESLKKIALISPCEGVIDEKKIEVGEIVSPQDEAFTILKVDKVYAEVGITEKDITKIKRRQVTEIKVDAYPQEKFLGEIKNILPSLKGVSRTLTLKIEIDNTKRKLLSGMFVRGDIILADLKQVYVVPKDALIKLTSTEYALTLIETEGEINLKKLEKEGIKGKVILKMVKVGYRGEKYAQVTGVNDNDLVVLQTTGILSKGMPVKIISIEEYKGGER